MPHVMQVDDVMQAYSRNFCDLKVQVEDEWATLTGEKM
jgi:hypothetical protein